MSTTPSLSARQKLVLTRNVILLESLREVLIILNKKNISSIVLKGASYLPILYDNDSEREMTDIDLYVSTQDLAKVKVSLKGLGFEAMPSSRSAMWRGHPIPVIIDLHSHLWYEPNSDAVWAHSVPAVIEDQPTRILDWEEMILFHIAHAILQHAQWEKRDQDDLLRILSKASRTIRWDLLRSRASRTNLIIPVSEALQHLARLGEFKIPDSFHFRTRQRTWRDKLLAHYVRKIMTSKKPILYADYVMPLLVRPALGAAKWKTPPSRQNKFSRLLLLGKKAFQGLWGLR